MIEEPADVYSSAAPVISSRLSHREEQEEDGDVIMYKDPMKVDCYDDNSMLIQTDHITNSSTFKNFVKSNPRQRS